MKRLLLLIALLPSLASAQVTNYWVCPTNNGLASVASNWSLGEIPTNPANNVMFSTNGLAGSNTTCIIDTGLSGTQLIASNFSARLYWNANGLHTFSNVFLVQPQNSTYRSYFHAGTINCSGAFQHISNFTPASYTQMWTWVKMASYQYINNAGYQPRLEYVGSSTNTVNGVPYGAYPTCVVATTGIVEFVGNIINPLLAPFNSLTNGTGGRFAAGYNASVCYAGIPTNDLSSVVGSWTRVSGNYTIQYAGGVWTVLNTTNTTVAHNLTISGGATLVMSNCSIVVPSYYFYSFGPHSAGASGSIIIDDSKLSWIENWLRAGGVTTTVRNSTISFGIWGNSVGWTNNLFTTNSVFSGGLDAQGQGLYLPANQQGVTVVGSVRVNSGSILPTIITTNTGVLTLGTALTFSTVTNTTGWCKPVGYTYSVSNHLAGTVVGSNSTIVVLGAWLGGAYSQQTSTVISRGASISNVPTFYNLSLDTGGTTNTIQTSAAVQRQFVAVGNASNRVTASIGGVLNVQSNAQNYVAFTDWTGGSVSNKPVTGYSVWSSNSATGIRQPGRYQTGGL
jgi:hypothetical protein